MPSLKMKTKSTTSNIREKNGLRVCQTSMISKSSPSQVRISQHEAGSATCSHIKQEISLCNNAHSQDVKGDDSHYHNLLDGENVQILMQPSASNDLETDMRVILGHALAPCISSLETIFSPTLEIIGDHNELDILSIEGSKVDLEASSIGIDDSDDNGRNSCIYQTCNVSDFNISDMIFSEIPNKGHLSDFNETASFPDYKCDELSVVLDEKVMIMPFLEDSFETSISCNGRLCEDTASDSVDSSLCASIHQLKSYDQESDANTHQNWDQADFLDLDLFIRTLTDVSDASTNDWPPTKVMPNATRKKKSTTLVLDLDETLVHSTLDHSADADFTFPVYFNMKEHIVYVKKRPFLHTFLERVADMFEVVIFTASQSIYAKQLLDILDPDQNVISRRAYRESCIFVDGCYTKDLTVLGVDLANIAIIDNSPQVFRLQVNNGIPIKSWFDDKSDCALITLLPFLETLVDVEDVRPIIAKKFGNKE